MTPTLDILASGSKANAYVVTAGNERLLIECGVKPSEILKAIDYDVDSVVACLLSHSHSDHCGYAKQILGYDIPIYTNNDTAIKIGLDTLWWNELSPRHRYKFGSFAIMPLSVPHGDCPNYAYVIDHPDTGRIVFATDCEDFSYDIKDVTTLMIEANYSEEILLNKALDGEEIRSRSETHMEINRAISVIERLQSPKLRRVVLLHLSDGFSDERAFIEAVKEKVGDMVEVYAADKGMRIGLDKDWF